LAKKILKAKDIEALENTQGIVAFGLTGTETMNCPTLNTCDGTHNCPTLADCTTFTGVCPIGVRTLDTSCLDTLDIRCGTTFTGAGCA